MLFKADIVHDYICISNELKRGDVLPDLTIDIEVICFADLLCWKQPVYGLRSLTKQDILLY